MMLNFDSKNNSVKFMWQRKITRNEMNYKRILVIFLGGFVL